MWTEKFRIVIGYNFGNNTVGSGLLSALYMLQAYSDERFGVKPSSSVQNVLASLVDLNATSYALSSLLIRTVVKR